MALPLAPPRREGAPPPDQFVYLGAVQLPHTHGNDQSATLPLSSGRCGLHASALIGSLVCHTTSNCPSGRISPIITGFDRWWLVCMAETEPEGAFTFCPYIACRTASTSVVPACCTACAHILKPM